jgi:16S rRNA processing protein RimM
VLGAKGLAGALRIEPLTDWPEHLDVDGMVYFEGESQPRRITAAEWGGRVPAIRVEGIDSRDDAEAAAGKYLEAEAPALPEGSYYWHQLEGLSVRDEDGRQLGVVREVFRAGEAEVYRVEQTDGHQLLIPGVRDVVRRIDLGEGVMVVRYEAEEVR